MNRAFGMQKYALALAVLSVILSPFAAWSGSQVPFKANLSLQGALGNPNTCTNGTLLIVISGGGYATHLGATTDQQSHCQNVLNGQVTDGQYTFTSANGDTISGTYSAQLIPSGASSIIQGQFTITGGTGRFSGASGGGAASGIQRADGSASLTWTGTISSVGSTH
jgi:hypothetical protein